MPRIRKKTSNRQNTRDRAKIKRKVSEHNKKQKRDQKRNPTWKSKKKADIGIPNSFHLKDQVLADQAREKRLAEEAKLAKREALKQKSKASEAEEEDTPGIVSLQSKVLTATSALPRAGPSKKTLDDEVPDLVDRALSTLQEVIDRADIILEIVDARDIQGGRSGYIEEMIEEAEGQLIVVVNKADLVPRETLSAWLSHLPPTALLFSSTPLASSSSSSAPVLPGLAELQSSLATLSKSSKSDEPLVVALMGLPSVGKTSILNSLLSPSQTKHAVTPAILTAANAKHPDPTTKAPVEVKITLAGGEVVHIIDTPGWEYAEDELDDDDEEDDEMGGDLAAAAEKWDRLEEQVAGDLLRRNLGRIDRVKNAMAPVNYIIGRSNSEDLMTCYNLPYFQEGNVEAFLIALARANGRLKKGGEPDLDAAARIVLRDWSLNQFPYYSTPPKAESATGVTQNAERDAVKAVLESLRTRKEMRSSGRGLVRFRGGEIDSREIILDDDYLATAGPSDDEEEEDEDDEAVEEDEDDELDEDDGELEDGSEVDDDEEGSLDSETERFLMDAANGEELDLEDGSEPESGSDVPSDADSEDEDEDEDNMEAPVVGSKRKAIRSPVAKSREPIKRKRVAFGAGVKFNEKPVPKAPKAGKLGMNGKRKRDEAELPMRGKAEKKVKPLPVKAAKAKAKAPVGKAAEKKPKAKAAVFQSSAKANGKGADEAYDFSKHF